MRSLAVSFLVGFLFLLFEISLAVPNPIATPHHAVIPAPRDVLGVRQLQPRTQTARNTTEIPMSDIPSGCTTTCAQDVLALFYNCSTDGCSCTDGNSQDVTNCANCLVSSGDITQAVATALQKNYVNTCKAMGQTVLSNVNAAAARFTGSAAILAASLVAALIGSALA